MYHSSLFCWWYGEEDLSTLVSAGEWKMPKEEVKRLGSKNKRHAANHRRMKIILKKRAENKSKKAAAN